jgi:hypothetical protein
VLPAGADAYVPPVDVIDARSTDAPTDAALPDAGADAKLPDAGADATLLDAGADAKLPDASAPDASAPDAGPSCAHDPCVTGAPLVADCSTCVTSVCNEDPFCCTGAWDVGCVQQAEASCGLTCGGGCGDGQCQAPLGEKCSTCAVDCGPCPGCGDGTCQAQAGETCASCAADCGPCAGCGDGLCQAALGESCMSCLADCGPCGGTCTHDVCTPGPPLPTTCGVCPQTVCMADAFCCETFWDSVCVERARMSCAGVSCGATCGDGDCTFDESCVSCALDCGQCPGCGNGVCQPQIGETCQTCAADCGVCP